MKNPLGVPGRMSFSLRPGWGLVLAFVLLLVVSMVSTASAGAVPLSPLTVTTTADDNSVNGNCSLREAIIAANTDAPVDACPAGLGPDTIVLPAGIYSLSVAGSGEDAAATGDLDVSEVLTISGAGARETIIDASAISDRVFHILLGSNITISGVTIRNGFGRGAGILNEGTLTVNDSTISNNDAPEENGAGIFNPQVGTLTLNRSTLRDNYADNNGGGLFNGGTVRIRNSTISANTAGNNGGGIFNHPTGELTINNSTISNNTAGNNGGGIKNDDDGSISFHNTIIAGNNTQDLDRADCADVEIDGGAYNLVGLDTGCPTSESDLTVDPAQVFTTVLGPLQDNGGPTDTHALLAGSPAIDAGNPAPPGSGDSACETVDQRGVSRPQGDACDIGAVEEVVFENTPPVAEPDEYSVDEDSTLTVDAPGVLENDSDVDEDSLTAIQVSSPSQGELTFNADGSFSYTPNQNFDGTDSFTYKANDGLVDSNIVTVTLSVIPDPFIEVTNTNDSGPGSLRNAILTANDLEGADTIIFEIPGAGPYTIQLASGLPPVTDPAIIDGTTQPGGPVTLDGAGAGPGGNGLTISAGQSTVRGLVITQFSGHGILLTTTGGNTIEGNTITANGGDGVRVAEGSGNAIRGNAIFDNGLLGIDLGGDGVTPNDTGDPDAGANDLQNFPVLIRAFPDAEGVIVEGRLNSAPNTNFDLDFYANPVCDPSNQGEGETFVGSTSVATDGSGHADIDVGLWLPESQFLTATATDPNGNTSEFSQCVSIGPANDSWPRALRLYLEDLSEGEGLDLEASSDQFIDKQGQSRWYKFSIQPNSKVIVTLTDLPANYDLTIYTDVAAAYEELTSPQEEDLVRLGAEFAADAFSADAFSADAFSADAFSADAFSADAFSADAFSADAFSADAFSADAFSADAFSADAFSADAFSADAFSADAFSADAFSADAFSADAFSADAFSSAQTRSLIGVSAFEGTASEGILVNTWNRTGDMYVRVRGRNGAFSLAAPFHLQVTLLPGACEQVSADGLPATSHSATAGNYRTIILTDFGRMEGTQAEKDALMDRLNLFKARPEVAGVVVDVGADARVAAANAQADASFECPYAKNLVADAIKHIIDDYRTLNPLEYVVIIGNDDTIPFYRYPDQALLANELNYVPPVRDSSASQASLKLGYVLGQDEYGSSVDLSLKINTFPIPDLAVGRLVETAVDAQIMLDAYLATTDGIVTPSTSPLVTGYDFLEDAARAIQVELEAGTGIPADTLIADQDLPPTDPSAWTAADLRALLLSNRHDLIFLAGHFTANSALAADYTTRLVTADLVGSPLDLTNAIVFSAGCHSGYNIVNGHNVPGVTVEPDWAQAFARKGAVLIGGTGYQYGDTEFLEYSERLYLEFSRQLRTGSNPVSIGQALMKAKQIYLATTPQLRGIHEKALLEATIFGLPMLKVNMPGQRLDPPADASIVTALNSFNTNPGATLGLEYADVTVTPSLSPVNVELTNVEDGTTVMARYLSGSDGIVTNPVEPTLPRESRNVTVPGTVLRGVGFRGGEYTDVPNVLPLTGAPTTEIRGVHTPFGPDYFYPVQLWRVNYFDALADAGNGATRLAITPAQYRSDDFQTSTERQFGRMDFRLYYSDNVEPFADSLPALADAPTILRVFAEPTEGEVIFQVNVVGDPTAGIQEVWVTYTVCPTGEPPCNGAWQPLDLTQDPGDSTLWTATLALDGIDPAAIRYMVQAVNGVGLVSLATNLGAFFVPGVDPGALPPAAAPTELTLEAPPTSGAYGTKAAVSAILSSNGAPLAGQRVSFGLGGQARQATTDSSGRATVSLPLLGLPGLYDLQAVFAGTPAYKAAVDTAPFEITKQATVLTLEPATATAPVGGDTGLVATLTDATGRSLRELTVFFVLTSTEEGGDSFNASVITDYAGRASLGTVPLPPGTYDVMVYFNGAIPLATGETVTLDDARYTPSATSGSLTLISPVAPFAALGQLGVWLQPNVVVVSGDVGANEASSPPFLSEGVEVIIGNAVRFLDPSSRVLGDSVVVNQDAQVYDVYYNEFLNRGTVLGQQFTPLDLPVVPALPSVPGFTAGTQNVTVPRNGTQLVEAGSYADLTAGPGSTVTFAGGVYDFRSWNVGRSVNLRFLAPAEIRVLGKVVIDQSSYLGPDPSATGLDAADIVIYVLGLNGDDGDLRANPKAATFGTNMTVIANIYAPNGTLWFKHGGAATGAFLGKWVIIGRNITLSLESGW